MSKQKLHELIDELPPHEADALLVVVKAIVAGKGGTATTQDTDPPPTGGPGGIPGGPGPGGHG